MSPGKNTDRQNAHDPEAEVQDLRATLAAASASQAVIEFEMDGTILTANPNFLAATGYTLEEIQGRHHRMFVGEEHAASAEYRAFWERLGRGEFEAREYKRFAKGGREIWIQASYNPILDAEGKPYKVVKFATDVTAQKLANADFQGQIDAVHKAQAVIEFEMDGTIRSANANFLATVGYSLDEIQGQHHRMFVPEEIAQSSEYAEFWARLGRGEYQADEFRRIGRGGREIWIQASYNPILDLNGRPFKVVKYATDITGQKQAARETARFVAEMSQVLERVSGQDMTVRLSGEYSGDHAATKENLNRALEVLETALIRVGDMTGQVSSASEQISQGSQQLAEGASTQASSIEEISASLEEMSSMTGQNADNAQQARSLADEAKSSANQGDEQMARMKEAIDAIKASSDQTAKIVKTIDEISFQTNMLALNAAVEAARAGDAGKGFAVVAEEVRSLAQRSAEAAKNTAELIEGSGRNVDNGVTITEGVQAILAEITGGVSKVSDLITEIAAASKEQAEGIKQVNLAVDGMNKVTQENAANSEESSAAATELNSQVAQLLRLVGEFDLTQDQATAAPAVTQRPAVDPPAAALPSGRTPAQAGGVIAHAFPLDDGELADF